jgi:hypothetical protein
MPLRVSEAEGDVLILQRRRSAALERARELADERQSVTAAAQRYEVGARARLSEINQALAVLDSELRNVDAALSEAGRVLALTEKERTDEHA